MILKGTPNLTNLTIDAYDNIDMVNASQWEHLFTSSLPYLKIFKFKIQCSSSNNNNYIKEKFEEFQSDFWCKQHHWYTEYILSKYSAVIYTIPYMFNTYRLTSNMIRYCNELMNSSNTFDNVTDLTINPGAITEKCQYHFSYVTLLTLSGSLNTKHIEHLKMIVSLSNLKHLVITSNCKLETPSVLLELLKEASQVSSLDMRSGVLISLFNDDELCKYLNKMITELYITDNRNSSMDDSCVLNQFCRTFSNTEQLSCNLDQRDSLLFLVKHLPKLSRITTFSSRFTCGSVYWLENRQLGGRNITDFNHSSSRYLTIWFTKDIC